MFCIGEDSPLHFDRVFISANSLNIQVFNAIANHETYRHQVSEIVWDDARLRTGPELEVERRRNYDEDDDDAEDGCPLWFKKGRGDWGDPGSYIYPESHLGVKESWAYYKPLLDDQHQVISSNADIKAFKYGLRRFTSLKRVTITPATHGTYFKPLYRTPMIRAFPPGIDYPLPQAWPWFNDDHYIDVLPWISESDDGPYQEVYGVEYTAEYEDHGIAELVIGGNEVQSGLNCRLFDQWSSEYGDLISLLKRPGFRYLDLHMFTGLLEEDEWHSYKTGLLHDALAQSKDLEYMCLRASTDISCEVPQLLTSEDEWDVCPLQAIFPSERWARLQHFGISQMLVDLDDLINLLASLPSSLRSVEFNHVALGSLEHNYGDLLRAMRDVLDWRSRPSAERPKVRMVASSLDDDILGDGRYVEVDQAVYSYLYGKGDNPFEADGHSIYPGSGGVERDVFDTEFKAPY